MQANYPDFWIAFGHNNRTPLHTMTTMITTKPPVTITAEITVMTITTIDAIVTD